ncbi:hypothetical protein MM1S1530915_0775 [Mycobacteroides abscessus subsp. bolletii 1S-153-0915]|nr:hypothetical protein MM1S1520914_1438 [Mycobacteroides abscessus subsp. bolletii 1S-152-0914]EIU81852.1 hypothetical protein MM1S1530915_0775 [Mycobacteroides abscessus subsp. bolletii 1S-153-0915]
MSAATARGQSNAVVHGESLREGRGEAAGKLMAARVGMTEKARHARGPISAE